MNHHAKKISAAILLSLCIFAILMQWFHVGIALISGIAIALTLGNPFIHFTQKIAGHLLKASVVGLGFSLNLPILWQQAQQGFWVTLKSIAFAFDSGCGTLNFNLVIFFCHSLLYRLTDFKEILLAFRKAFVYNFPLLRGGIKSLRCS